MELNETAVQETMEAVTDVAQEVVPEVTKKAKKVNGKKVFFGVVGAAITAIVCYRLGKKYKERKAVKPAEKVQETEETEEKTESNSEVVEPETLN